MTAAGAPASAPSLPRMLLQIYRCFGIEEFFVVLESALAAGMLGTSGMRWLRMHSNAAIREALALARNDADSGLESLLRWRLRRRGLRVRTQRQVFAVGRVDLLIGERLLVEVLRCLVPDVVRHRIGLVAEPRHRLGQRERGALGIGEVRRVAPGRDREDAVVGLSGLLQRAGVHADADAAAVDLTGAQIDDLAHDLGHAGVLAGLVQRIHGLQGIRQNEHQVLHTGMHD